MTKEYTPIIIIGAPRSGTNILRDVISAQPGFATWPCDEINYIWRYGNSGYPYDELPVDLLNPKIENYIRKQFAKIASKYQSRYVVEKTCANCLRLEFVTRIFPGAVYINILRDGRDAAASAMKRWKAPLDIPYILKKARFVPPGDLPFYASRYLKTHLHRLFRSEEKSLSIWGPKFKDYETVVKEKSLAEVCAIQWLNCVQKSRTVFEKAIDPNRCFTISYEEFVLDPVNQLVKFFDFFSLPYDEKILQEGCATVWKGSIGKWKKDFSQEEKESVQTLLGDELKPWQE